MTKGKNQFKVIQTRSLIGQKPSHKKTIIGLGLRGVGKSKILLDTPSIRGMVNKVKHLVTIENI